MECSRSHHGNSLYESFRTPTPLTSPSLPTCTPCTPSPTMRRQQHQPSLYLTSLIAANSYINGALRQQRRHWSLFLAQWEWRRAVVHDVVQLDGGVCFTNTLEVLSVLSALILNQIKAFGLKTGPSTKNSNYLTLFNAFLCCQDTFSSKDQ